jgi:hypothetical protein
MMVTKDDTKKLKNQLRGYPWVNHADLLIVPGQNGGLSWGVAEVGHHG